MGPERRDVFTRHPERGYGPLIVRYVNEDDGRLAHCFTDAAARAILLPYLYLSRHVVELELKHGIRYAVAVRHVAEPHTTHLTPEELDERLRREHRHRLMSLLDELDVHLAALGVETVPSDVRRTVSLLAAADRTGEAFRYTGSLPDEQDFIDFASLHAAVSHACRMLSHTLVVLEPIRDALAEQAEFEAEFRRAYDEWSDPQW